MKTLILVVTMFGVFCIFSDEDADSGGDDVRGVLYFQVVKMLILVVTMFGVCWLPLHTFFLVIDFNPELMNYESLEEERFFVALYYSVHWLAMSNSFANPVIYSFTNDSFRVSSSCRGRSSRRNWKEEEKVEEEHWLMVWMVVEGWGDGEDMIVETMIVVVVGWGDGEDVIIETMKVVVVVVMVMMLVLVAMMFLMMMMVIGCGDGFAVAAATDTRKGNNKDEDDIM